MVRRVALMVLVGMGLVAAATGAQEKHGFVCADSGLKRLVEFSPEGEIVWEFKGPYCYDLTLLPNDNILFCHNGGRTSVVREITKAHEVVFEYKLEGEAFSCERLKNGNTLVGCCSAGELVEVDPGGNVVKTIPLTADAGGHGLMRLGRATPWGTYLVAHTGDKMVREYDASGAVIREIKAPDLAFGVVPLANKNILISTETAIIEVTPDDKEVWRLTGADIPEAGAAWLTGMRRLKNGNTLVCNWLGHGKEGTGVPLFEITPDKKIVWQFTDTEQTKWIASAQYVPAKDAE